MASKLLFVACLVACVLALGDSPNVVVVTDASIKQLLEENEFVLLDFYAPWCGHCKKLAPEFDRAADVLKEQGSKVVLGKVDSTVERESSTEFGVRGYPTLNFFQKGQLLEKYPSQRTAEAIVAYVTEKAGEKTVEPKTEL